MKFIDRLLSQRMYQIVLSIAIVVILTSISFSSSLDNGFTNWDDDKFITENYLIRDLSWDNVEVILTSFYKEIYRQPLVLLSFSLEYHFFKLDPFIYHLDNLILHILNALLVFYLVFLFSRKLSVSLLTALFFGIHPLHVESVAWASERKDVLSTFFLLQSIIFYLLYEEKKGWLYYYLSITVLILSLLSKAMGVTIPFILLLFDYFSGRRFDRKALLEKVPYFIVSGFFVIINVFLHYSAGAIISDRVFSFFDNVIIACKSVIFYLVKVVLPVNLSAFYPYPQVVSIQQPESFISVVLLLILVVVVFYSARYTRAVIFGSFFFFITILPLLKLIPFGGGGASMADRYMYIPSIGLFYMLGLLFHKIYNWGGSFQKVRKVTSVFVLSMVIIFFSALTYQRNNVWQDSETLWSNVLDNFPDSPKAHSSLGFAYFKQNKIGAAIKEYEEALRLNAGYVEAHNNLGVVYHKQNKIGEAIKEYEEALRLDPANAETHNNLGYAYYNQGKIGEAIEAYKEALRLDPENPGPHNNLARAYFDQHKIEDAIKEFKEALRIDPENADAHNSLGIIYSRQNKIGDAIKEYKAALKINAEYDKAHYNLANAYYDQNKTGEAIKEYREVLRLNPGHVSAHFNLALSYLKKGLAKEAIKEFNDLLKIQPDHLEARRILERITD